MTETANPRHELTLLVLSRYPLVVLEGTDEGEMEELVRRVALDLSLPLYEWTSTLGLSRAGGSRLPDTQDPERALTRLLGMKGEILVLLRDLHPYLERPEVRRRIRDLTRIYSGSRSTLLLAGVSVELPAELAHLAARLSLQLPSLQELEALVRQTAGELQRLGRIQADLAPDGVRDLAQALKGLPRGEAVRLLYRAALRDGELSAGDLPELLEGKRRRVRETSVLEWMEPAGGLEDLGGAPNFKGWVETRREAFGEAARRFGLDPPRGVLLTGVPGTGKSLACRALAAEWKLPLLRLDFGRLYDKFVGETEANLRRALGTAEAMAPAVLWIDEIEKTLAAGSGTADDGLSQRVLGSVLTWMQERPAPVFIAATANRVAQLPLELLRRGRFDEVFFFDLPGAEEREGIFALHLRRRGRRPEDFDLAALAASSEGFSGAEIEGVIAAALYHAFSQRCPLTTQILLTELEATRPLAALRPQEIAALRAWGREHAVPA